MSGSGPDETFPTKQHKRTALAFLLLLLFWLGVSEILKSSAPKQRPVAAGGFYIQPAPEISKNTDKTIDLNLKKGDRLGELSRLKVKVDNDKTGVRLDSNRLEPENILPDSQYRLGLETEQENSADQVHRDLENARLKQSRGLSPESKINARLAHKRWVKDYNDSYSAEFVKEFVRRAADDGWHVEIDRNYQVIAVRPLAGARPKRYPQSMSVSDGGSGTSQ